MGVGPEVGPPEGGTTNQAPALSPDAIARIEAVAAPGCAVRSILCCDGVPKPVVLVDTRERQPLPLREYHPNWVAAEHLATLKTGDYTVEGMEELLALERNSLVDMPTVGCWWTRITRSGKRRVLRTAGPADGG